MGAIGAMGAMIPNEHKRRWDAERERRLTKFRRDLDADVDDRITGKLPEPENFRSALKAGLITIFGLACGGVGAVTIWALCTR